MECILIECRKSKLTTANESKGQHHKESLGNQSKDT